MNKYLSLLALVTVIAASSCGDATPKSVVGYAPIYQTDTAIITVASIDPQPIVNGGKIYVKDKTLFQVEVGEGIHVIDITTPSEPKKVSFIHISGVTDLSVKGNTLYANNFNDLVSVDISNPLDATLLSRKENVFLLDENQFPPESGYYECVDASRGRVVGWKKQTIYSPKCRL